MTISYLGNVPEESLSPLEIPYFLNTVRVGWPSPADDYVEKPIDLNEYLIKNSAATYFVRVSGDSMIHAHIGDGAILIVDRSIEPTHNKIVIASINGSYACKRLLLRPKVCLMSENPKYSPIMIKQEEELEIAGTVTASINIY
ncbi:MAG: DNA polymerase V subunit UmuD [Gammaproteobacteria bacterium]|nr:DNA polymerase V subunit UmuD [Gammaproteobacteria bacterium]|tara:strand:- start:583 stop:1011 length:429 start_codon:yes stop_codon:yes gene_type:complete